MAKDERKPGPPPLPMAGVEPPLPEGDPFGVAPYGWLSDADVALLETENNRLKAYVRRLQAEIVRLRQQPAERGQPIGMAPLGERPEE